MYPLQLFHARPDHGEIIDGAGPDHGILPVFGPRCAGCSMKELVNGTSCVS